MNVKLIVLVTKNINSPPKKLRWIQIYFVRFVVDCILHIGWANVKSLKIVSKSSDNRSQFTPCQVYIKYFRNKNGAHFQLLI